MKPWPENDGPVSQSNAAGAEVQTKPKLYFCAMDMTYTAVYYNSSGRFYHSTIFLSSITLSIRFTNELNETKEVYWLAENIFSLEHEALSFVLL